MKAQVKLVRSKNDDLTRTFTAALPGLSRTASSRKSDAPTDDWQDMSDVCTLHEAVTSIRVLRIQRYDCRGRHA